MGELRITESFDIGDDWPWRWSVEEWVPEGKFLWWKTEGYWRAIASGKKLSTCKTIVANGGALSRIAK